MGNLLSTIWQLVMAKGWVASVIRIVSISYVVILIGAMLGQDKLIFPGHREQGQPYTKVGLTALPQSEVLSLPTANGEKIVALFGAALTPGGNLRAQDGSVPTVIYFYGNGSCLARCLSEIDLIRRRGANVIAADYLGYGMSSGKPSEANFYLTAETLYKYATTRKEVNAQKIIFCGWSIGAGVATEMASRYPAAGLILISPFTSIAAMVRKTLPIIVWPQLVLRHRFDNLAKISQVRCPLLLIHGRNDQLIPWQMSEELATRATNKAIKIYIPNADHGDIFAIGEVAVFTAISGFIKQVVPTPAQNNPPEQNN
jgi:uncharacterized protein